MSMKKAFDQTIRDIKREVNKKVRKVPSVEQKVLDATSNEPWGPHGSLLADVAQATKHHHEYPIVMSVIWKRINDTGKNWRHVYKALTILEYLVAHGSERVIDEIREHAYQISTLSDFQYIDSSGRDQGSNVRRKSQSLVLLVNDKERVQEVRQKAASNRDKFRSPSAGGMYRPSPSGGYGDDRYDISGRDDERNTYGRERDDDRYAKYGDGYNRRDSEEHYDRDSYRDDSSKGRRSSDGDRYGARSRSSDRYGDRVNDDDDSRSSRGSSGTVRAGDHPRDGRPLERKYSEQNLSAPPSYEDAVGDSRSPVGDSTSPTHSERSGETTAASAPQSSSPIANATQSFPLTASVAPQSSSSTVSINPSQVTSDHNVSSLPNVGGDPFDEFDPRGSFPAPPSASNNAEMDLFGSLSEVFAPNPLAIVPVASGTPNVEAGTVKDTTSTFAAEMSVLNQSFEDPFGDTPFKAISTDGPPTQNFTSMSSFQPEVSTFEPTPSVTQKAETANPDFLDAFPGLNDDPKTIPSAQTAQVLPEDPQLMQENDILAGILPPSQAAIPSSTGLPPEMGSQTAYPSMTGFMPQAGPTSTPFGNQNMALPLGQHTHQHSFPYSSAGFQAPTGTFSHQHNTFLADVSPSSQPAFSSSCSSSSSSSTPANSLALVPQQPAKQRFEPKSAVWTDTLNRGLVNLDISGPKTNPMADLGIDFETLNRKDKRMEKPTTSSAPTTSNVSMGKAMGSGTGMGRAGAGSLRPSVNPMIASGMGMGMGLGMPNGAGVGSVGQQPMGMGMGMGVGMANGAGVGPMGQQPMGMGMGGYGTMGQQPMAMGGMGMGMGMAGMNMRMGQGAPMQPPNNGLAPGSNMNNYNPMMGRGGYPQQPYGGGY